MDGRRIPSRSRSADLPAIGNAGLGADPGARLHLTVIFTTPKGTEAALKKGASLARGLGANLQLLVPEVVPHRLPIDRPPVALEHTREVSLALTSEFAAGGHDVVIEVCLCRDAQDCLVRSVSPRSLILVGGRDSWWSTPERKMTRSLRALGHEVIFVEQRESCHA